jgi:peroxiredoxin
MKASKLLSLFAIFGLMAAPALAEHHEGQATPAAAPVPAAPAIGAPAPDFTATDIKGQSFKLSDQKGKIVVLEWTNPGCPFVVKHYGSKNMQTLQKTHADQGVVWVSINSSAAGKEGNLTQEAAAKLVADQGINSSHYVLDASGEIGKLYHAKTTPHMFVIDKEGKLAYAGAIDSIASASADDIAKAENYVTKAIEAIGKGEAIATTTTAPYGCSVKYAN